MNPEKIGSGMTYCGGGWAFFCGLDANTIGMILGVLIGLVGLGISWYYQRKRDVREQTEHDARMGKL